MGVRHERAGFIDAGRGRLRTFNKLVTIPDATRGLIGLIFACVTRHDESKRSAAPIGDDARFVDAGTARDITIDEPGDLVQALWAAACSGLTARECDTRFAVDSHRIRKLLASWVEIDALKLAQSPEKAA